MLRRIRLTVRYLRQGRSLRFSWQYAGVIAAVEGMVMGKKKAPV